MTTLFIFVEALDASELLTLVLATDGSVLHALALRSFAEIKILARLGQTRIILPASRFSLHRVTLPLLQEKKAQTAIAYALEDNLAQSLSVVHIGFDRKFYANGQYLAVVCEKTYFADVLSLFVQHGIDPRFVTLDWFALTANEMVYCGQHILVHTPQFSGSLNCSDFQAFWKPDPGVQYHVLRCAEGDGMLSPPTPLPKAGEGSIKNGADAQDEGERSIKKGVDGQSGIEPNFSKENADIQDAEKQTDTHAAGDVFQINEPWFLWVAKRLLTVPQMNLRQGQFKQKTTTTGLFYWYTIAGFSFILWLLSTLVFNTWQIWYYNKQLKPLDSEIATIYRQFFPHARQIISPEFRMRQWLKSHQQGDDQVLFVILNQLGPAIDMKTMSIQRIEWHNRKMLLTLKSEDFEKLSNFQKKMSQHSVQISQKQASKQDDAVISVWELN